MQKTIDNLGRVVIPKEMRKQLGIKENDPINIECDGNKIILTKPDEVDYKAIVEEAIEYVKNRIIEDDYVLKKEPKMVRNELLYILGEDKD